MFLFSILKICIVILHFDFLILNLKHRVSRDASERTLGSKTFQYQEE